MVGFSDMQAALADKLIRAGLNVLVTNQRSVAEIVATSARTNAPSAGSQAARRATRRSPPRPRNGRAVRACTSRSGTTR